MKKSIIEELRQKFAVLPVEDLGDCIVVPLGEFDLALMSDFAAQGYSCSEQVLDGQPVVLVELGTRSDASFCKRLTRAGLERLRKLHCTCDDVHFSLAAGELCCQFKECSDALSVSDVCREQCPSFCRMWDELLNLLEASA